MDESKLMISEHREEVFDPIIETMNCVIQHLAPQACATCR